MANSFGAVLFASCNSLRSQYLSCVLQAVKSMNCTCIYFLAGSIPLVSPPSETVKLNRTSSVNLTCIVSGQPGFHLNWYKNRVVIPRPPLSQIHRTLYVNGSVKSVLTLNRVKYRDRGSIISCSAWYPTLSINSTRNIHLLVHGNICYSSYSRCSFQGCRQLNFTSVIANVILYIFYYNRSMLCYPY